MLTAGEAALGCAGVAVVAGVVRCVIAGVVVRALPVDGRLLVRKCFEEDLYMFMFSFERDRLILNTSLVLNSKVLF